MNTQDKPDEKVRKPDQPCFVVGIGASAGGLAAYEAFFDALSSEVGRNMAFVLVQHLSADNKSYLRELIGQHVRLKTLDIEDGIEVRPGCVYVIPPNRETVLRQNCLWLTEPNTPHGQWRPIDVFFRSLAEERHERAVGIVLSGCGMDGMLGLEAIKGEGGMVMAQDVESAEHDSMPVHAASTGVVDYVLSPDKMPAALAAYVLHASERPAPDAPDKPRMSEAVLKKICVSIQKQTGHDFSYYKKNTVIRRVERRMAIHQIRRLDKYVRHLQQTPEEIDALVKDLLIGVTGFFRDPDAFETLRKTAIRDILSDKAEGESFRVWAPGCSSGEEAFSIAMLIQEEMERAGKACRVQIFASDIDPQAVLRARAGLYSVGEVADVSPERLARFFAPGPDGQSYQIHRRIRDILVFSMHDVVRDPPFSKLDLVSCRNVLIYMDRPTQKRIVSLFHYALNPGGFLFLGSSESLGDMVDSFVVKSRAWKIYRRKETGRRTLLPSYRDTPANAAWPLALVSSDTAKSERADWPPPLRRQTERALLQRYAPVGALVNRKGDILYIHGRTGQFLEPAPGEAEVNIVHMAREGLQQSLNAALRKAATKGKPVRHPGLQVRTNGDTIRVNLAVYPLPEGSDADAPSDMLLVVFEEAAPSVSPSKPAPAHAPDSTLVELRARIAFLEEALRSKDEYLQATTEECETANEDLRAVNDAMQSAHEEMQSTNEELETSKEELQVINEELTTLNTELQRKVEELSQSENDMNNILACTGIGVVFVDHDLQIQRFTPAATQIINLIPGDVGRPVGHVVSNFANYDRLVEDVQEVLDTLAPKEIEVLDKVGVWRLLRITPYRTVENVIEGVAITFIEITDQKKMKEREIQLKQAVLTLRNVSRMIVRETDAQRLIERSCSIMIETRGYRNAWIALLDSETMTVHATASSGCSNRLSALQNVLNEGQFPSCATRALAQKDLVVVRDPSAECPDCILDDKGADFSGLACRLECDRQIFGVLVASVPLGLACNEEELGFFTELAQDIAFALNKIEKADKAG